MATEIDDNIARWNANFNPADWDPNDPSERRQIVNVLVDAKVAAGFEHRLRLLQARRDDRSRRIAGHLLVELDEQRDEDEQRWQIDPHANIDGWQLDGQLGSGSNGRVFKASRYDGEPVALKLLASVKPNAMMWKPRAASEVAVLRRLKGQPHIIQYVAEGTHLGRCYLVMELARATSTRCACRCLPCTLPSWPPNYSGASRARTRSASSTATSSRATSS